MFRRLSLLLVVLMCFLVIGGVQAQDASPTPEGEVTEEAPAPVVDVEELQQQVLTLQTTNNLLIGVIVVLILTVGLALILLGRSAPPGAFKEIASVVGGTVVNAGAGEVLATIEHDVKLTESQWDDVAAKIARAVYDKITTQPAVDAPVPVPETGEAKG